MQLKINLFSFRKALLTQLGFLLILLQPFHAVGQNFLPPTLAWKGKSETLIVKKSDPWITPAERSDFLVTPSFSQTRDFLEKLCALNPKLKMREQKLPTGEGLLMVYTGGLGATSLSTENQSKRKPLLLVQAGIHSGEIDGKDAGLMLLRDFAVGKKPGLFDAVDLIFIPILNVFGHEQMSKFNRPNQRGPTNMGLRTNGQNLNLNRDFMKQETAEIQWVISLLNQNKPDLYMDIHVTDGADYQYDITYGYVHNGHSPAIGRWLDTVFTPTINQDLASMGHVPGPFLNTTNGRDFSEGISEYYYGPNFSHGYGNLAHLPTILVENHSLKPYKQRVLGTYVLIESTLKLLAERQSSLQTSLVQDENRRDSLVPFAFRVSAAQPDSFLLKGIRSRIERSALSGGEYVAWLGTPETQKVAFFREEDSYRFVRRPKGYLIPATHFWLVERLQNQGISVEKLLSDPPGKVFWYQMSGPVFSSQPNEGRIKVKAKAEKLMRNMALHKDFYLVSTDQPLGNLAMLLLEPEVPESLFQWGFFNSIFQRTEYAEDYFLEPMAVQMLKESPELQQKFDQKKKAEPAFANNPKAILEWFYAQSPYYDQRFSWYPVLRVE